MNDVQMEELLPIVAELTVKYTRNESTSVTYEKAEQLMGAVIYCIQEYELHSDYDADVILKDVNQNGAAQREIIRIESVSARKAYELGCQLIRQKIEMTRRTYNEMIIDFQAYGNENYQDTVTEGISGFFKLYDLKFAPQNTVITMDYPTLHPIGGLQGIDAIAQYLQYICLEQKFMRALPQERVVQILEADQADYRSQFYNICGVILRELLGRNRIRMWIQEIPSTQVQSKAFCKELEGKLTTMLEAFIQEHYEADPILFDYLKAALPDFSVELVTGYGMNGL